MIRVRIGNDEREISSADDQWINQQLNGRRADSQNVCIRVIIKEDDLDMILSTPGCAGSGGGGRPPRPREKSVFDLWDKRNLNDPKFSSGNLIAFLHQLRSFI